MLGSTIRIVHRTTIITVQRDLTSLVTSSASMNRLCSLSFTLSRDCGALFPARQDFSDRFRNGADRKLRHKLSHKIENFVPLCNVILQGPGNPDIISNFRHLGLGFRKFGVAGRDGIGIVQKSELRNLRRKIISSELRNRKPHDVGNSEAPSINQVL